MSETLALSTPTSKTTSSFEQPSMPSKKLLFPNLDHLSLRNYSPSKPYRFSRSLIKSNSLNIIPQRLSLDITIPIENDNDLSPTIYEGSLSRKLNNDSQSISPASDFGSVSPFCSVSSIPSSSPDLIKAEPLDPFNVDSNTWNTKPFANKDAFELNKMIHSTLVDYKNKILRETRPVKKPKLNGTKSLKHVPCHRCEKPRKSILNLHEGSLNLLVSSSRGSLQDATIFATEINASVNKNKNKLPTISSIWERITIPVNSEIKEKYKRMKVELFADANYDSSEDDEVFKFEDSEEFYQKANDKIIQDSALIRGFEFENYRHENNNNEDVKFKRSIKWADRLEYSTFQ